MPSVSGFPFCQQPLNSQRCCWWGRRMFAETQLLFIVTKDKLPPSDPFAFKPWMVICCEIQVCQKIRYMRKYKSVNDMIKESDIKFRYFCYIFPQYNYVGIWGYFDANWLHFGNKCKSLYSPFSLIVMQYGVTDFGPQWFRQCVEPWRHQDIIIFTRRYVPCDMHTI